MQQLEQKIDELVKKVPYQLPDHIKQSLVKAMPYLTVAGGVLMLFAAFNLYQIASWASGVSATFGVYAPTVTGLTFMLWVSLAILVAEAVAFFLAFPHLQKRAKQGWNILFWVSLVNAVESILQVFGYGNFGSLILSLLSSAIGLYLLFQIRSAYTGATSAPKTPPAGATKPQA